MKRIIAAIAVLLLLCSCAPENNSPGQTLPVPAAQDKIYGVWLTSYELAPDSFSCSKADYEKKIEAMCENIADRGLTDIFVHVRPNCDAFYRSELFPTSDRLAGVQGGAVDFDALEIMVKQARRHSLRIHAWINPYRVSAVTADISSLSEKNPARVLYEKGGNDVVLTDGGIYLNPASEKTQRLVLDGVREILDGYDVDGIHIDDYFYPSTEEGIDKTEYDGYKAGGGAMSRADFRRGCVSALVSGIYRAVKAKDEKLLFTVSPCGDIDKNYNELYADVRLWCSQDGYADLIIPQIYYGFENDSLPFESCLQEWISLGSAEKLCIGLACYKAGQEDKYAGSGFDEWIEHDDVISRQTDLTDNSGCSGWCLFSYSYFNINI